MIANTKKATKPSTDPTDDPTTDPTTPGTEPTTGPTDNPTEPVSGELTWKVVDSEGKAVAGTSFQVTPLGKDGKPTAAAFEVTDFASGPTTFGVPTDLDAATGAYRVKVSDVTLQYQLEQLTTAEGLQLAAAQTLSFSKGTDGKWSQNAASSLVNPVAPEEPPTTDPTNEPSTPSTDPTAEPQPGDNGGASNTKPSAGQNGGATEAPAGAYMTGGSSAASSSAAGPAPSSLRVTGANGGTLALISAILALAGAGVLTARKLREDR